MTKRKYFYQKKCVNEVLVPEGHEAPKYRKQYFLQTAVIDNKLNDPFVSSIIKLFVTHQTNGPSFFILSPK